MPRSRPTLRSWRRTSGSRYFFRRNGRSFSRARTSFESPLQPFYSRTIVDPDIALKLTGKFGKNTFGILAASDNAPGNYSEDERGELRMCQQGQCRRSPAQWPPPPMLGDRGVCRQKCYVRRSSGSSTISVKKTTSAFSRRRGRFRRTEISSAALTANSSSIRRRQ